MADLSHEAILKRIARMEGMLKNFRIIGAGVEIQGSLEKGYSMNASLAASTGAPASVVCEADIEGDYTGGDEEFVDINANLPYDITVQWIELAGTHTEANSHLYYGASGEGATAMIFADVGDTFAIPGDTLRFDATPPQPVPAGGFLQLNVGDWADPLTVTGTVHYKIHYTYRCSDGAPI